MVKWKQSSTIFYTIFQIFVDMFKSYYYLVKVKEIRQFIYAPMTMDFKMVTDFWGQKPKGNNSLNLLSQLWFQPSWVIQLLIGEHILSLKIMDGGYETTIVYMALGRE